MQIIEIQARLNGAHRNQSGEGTLSIPEGWAVIPEDMELPESFPFVDIETERYTPEDAEPYMVVTVMTAREVPEPEPEPEPEPTQLDRVEAQAMYTALMTDTLLEEE